MLRAVGFCVNRLREFTFSFAIICLLGGAGEAPPTDGTAADGSCSALIRQAINTLRNQKIEDIAAVCIEGDCPLGTTFSASLVDLKNRIAALADSPEKLAALKAIGDLQASHGALKSNLPKLLPGTLKAKHSDAQKAIETLLKANTLCAIPKTALLAVVATLKTTVDALHERANVSVCEDKVARLPDFIASYYGRDSSPLPALTIERARYGDIYNEDRDELGSHHLKSAAWDEGELGEPDPSIPRAGKIFSDPEDTDFEPDWERHRHTCDITWFMKKKCDRKGCDTDGSCAGESYCIIIQSAVTADQAAYCGYDPSPQGDKRIHVKYRCGGDPAPRYVKLPWSTKNISLICQAPPMSPEAERAYFEAPPCPIALPLRSVVAAQQQDDSDVDKTKTVEPEDPKKKPEKNKPENTE